MVIGVRLPPIAIGVRLLTLNYSDHLYKSPQSGVYT
jgi:hypothetical protein